MEYNIELTEEFLEEIEKISKGMLSVNTICFRKIVTGRLHL